MSNTASSKTRSPDQTHLIQVGKVMDAHGIRGDLYCLVFSGDVSWIGGLETLTLKKAAAEAENFTIERIKPFKKGFIVTLEGFADRNRAELFKSAEVWVSDEYFVAEEGEALFLREILGFRVLLGADGAEFGHIHSFSSNGAQDLLVIEKDGRKYEIPFVEDFVLNLDHGAREIRLSLPEGLLEINDAD